MEDIIIKQLNNGTFDVHVGNRNTEQLTFDEMIGVIVQLTMPNDRRCLQWLKTEEEHRRFRERSRPEDVVIREYGRTKPYAINKIGGQTNETM